MRNFITKWNFIMKKLIINAKICKYNKNDGYVNERKI